MTILKCGHNIDGRRVGWTSAIWSLVKIGKQLTADPSCYRKMYQLINQKNRVLLMSKATRIYNTLDYLRRKGKWHLRKSAIAAVNSKISWTDLKLRSKNSPHE